MKQRLLSLMTLFIWTLFLTACADMRYVELDTGYTVVNRSDGYPDYYPYYWDNSNNDYYYGYWYPSYGHSMYGNSYPIYGYQRYYGGDNLRHR